MHRCRLMKTALQVAAKNFSSFPRFRFFSSRSLHAAWMCRPACGIPPGISSLLRFSSSLPPHDASVHPILPVRPPPPCLPPPPPLREEIICHSLTSACQMMDNSVTVLFFLLSRTSNQEELLLPPPLQLQQPPAVTSTLSLPGPKDVGTPSKKMPDDALEDLILFSTGCIDQAPAWVCAQHF